MNDNLFYKTQKICQDNNIRPQKKHGQNFLIKSSVYDKIIGVADLRKTDKVLEIGPGLGFLTERLSHEVSQVSAVEVDKKLYNFLVNKLRNLNIKNVVLINQDVLQLKHSLKYNKIVANLPYNISARFLRQFLTKKNRPDKMILLLQKEVVERIIALPGKMSILAVSVQYLAQAELVAYVSRADFWPSPQVDSAIIKIDCQQSMYPQLSIEQEKKFWQLVKIGFSAKRKMLKNNLASGYQLSHTNIENRLKKVGLNIKSRAQDLSVADWQKLLGEFL